MMYRTTYQEWPAVAKSFVQDVQEVLAGGAEGRGYHSLAHGGATLPSALRWLWRE
jgi:hypothetical protein